MEVLHREEARFTIVATLHDVQRQAVEVDAGAARHGQFIAGENNSTLAPLTDNSGVPPRELLGLRSGHASFLERINLAVRCDSTCETGVGGESKLRLHPNVGAESHLFPPSRKKTSFSRNDRSGQEKEESWAGLGKSPPLRQ